MANRRNRNRLSSAYHRRLSNSRPSRYYREELEKYEQWMQDNSKASHIAYIDETYLEPEGSKHGFYAISAFVLEANRVAPTRENVMRDLYDMVELSGARNKEYPRVFYHFTAGVAEDSPERVGRPWLTDRNNTKLLEAIGNMPAGEHYLFTDYYIPHSSNKAQLEQNMEEARGRALAPALLFLNQKYPGIAVVFESRNIKINAKKTDTKEEAKGNESKKESKEEVKGNKSKKESKEQDFDKYDKQGIERLKNTGLLPKNFSYTHISPSIDPNLIVPDGTGWGNRRVQINGEAERLTQAGIKQITLDAYSLHPIQFGPQYPHNPAPNKGPKIENPHIIDHIHIARGTLNKSIYVSQALRSQYPSNDSRSPAKNAQDAFRKHDYFMQGYNQSRTAQGNYDVAFAQSVFNKKLTPPQQRSYLHVEKTIATTPALIAQLPDSVRNLAQATRHQMKLLYGKTTNEKETPKTSSPKVTGQAQQNAAQNEKTSEKPAQSLDPENAQLLDINQRTISASLRNLPKTQQQSPSPRRPEPPTPGLEL